MRGADEVGDAGGLAGQHVTREMLRNDLAPRPPRAPSTTSTEPPRRSLEPAGGLLGGGRVEVAGVEHGQRAALGVQDSAPAARAARLGLTLTV